MIRFGSLEARRRWLIRSGIRKSSLDFWNSTFGSHAELFLEVLSPSKGRVCVLHKQILVPLIDVGLTPVPTRVEIGTFKSKPDNDFPLNLWNPLTGDLKERYSIKLTIEGRPRAILWVLRQVITSLPPFAWAWLKHVSGLAVIYRRIGR